ncbi:carboxylesterase family protein [Fulvimarina sp. 2208YS6-2-32]|uniref:Carboxylic ester hydrolase n=1 Tax=Fulvimarina uroteuthidis TaxID=3098149 RepID=A0ABU5I2X1_9HYPH|nr:carboxylesterase family protein [Fulvimarina sp. 2208YS6-2-32]MDY8109702.1 carboxylesterase family protein [Fulvimarina sp. 2208YS6-2-32]
MKNPILHRTARRAVFVKAPCGLVEGLRLGGTCRFLGIPYAQAPVGERRFAAPARKPPFASTFRALKFGPSAPQREALPGAVAHLASFARRFSEDCLNLHVFTPDISGQRAVLVFIHGGGFFLGSGSQYPGDELARRGDIVVVTLNYRLGLFGFNGFAERFADDERFAANAGLLDQRMALEWVRDNIGAFGGDPRRVTIAGESAGAASVGFHLVAERSKPLYQRAICQSGAINMFHTRKGAGAIADVALSMLAPGGDREALFALPARTFVEAFRKLSARFQGLPTMPYIDGTELPELPLPTLYERSKPVPLLIGTNRDEFTLFVDLPGFGLAVGPEDLSAWVTRTAGAEKAREILSLYSRDGRGSTQLGTDILFRIAASHLAEHHAAKAPTFVYRLDWTAKGALAKLGATHSVDLPLIFDRFLVPFRSSYLGILPDPKRRALSLRMQDHWTAFVRDGDPGRSWPAYRPETRMTKIFDLTDSVEADPARDRRLAWTGVDGFVP